MIKHTEVKVERCVNLLNQAGLVRRGALDLFNTGICRTHLMVRRCCWRCEVRTAAH